MRIERLYLKNYRNHESEIIEFGPEINNIVGPNARGKTNLLEAVYFLITGRSFRGHPAQNLIRDGNDFFRLEAIFEKSNIKQKLLVHFDGHRKKVMVNATSYASFSHLLGLMQGVVMKPEDVTLISGAPILRRQFLDLQTAQVDPLYVHHMSRYTKALKTRNHLLRKRKTDSLPIWEREMAQSASYICMSREACVADLSLKTHAIQGHISDGRDQVHLTYKSHGLGKGSKEDLRDYFLDAYASGRQKDLLLGETRVGPHKDDVIITLNEKSARFFASEGQKRTCAMSLRLAEWQRLKEMEEGIPLMAIDDMESALDEKRRDAVGKYLGRLGQVLITSTHILHKEESRHIAFSQGTEARVL